MRLRVPSHCLIKEHSAETRGIKLRHVYKPIVKQNWYKNEIESAESLPYQRTLSRNKKNKADKWIGDALQPSSHSVPNTPILKHFALSPSLFSKGSS